MKAEIDSLLQGGIIEPCKGPWSSPIVPIKKPDGSLRLCVDFRRINAVTIPDPFCMPLIDDILDNVGDCPYLSKLDLAKGFYQVPIQPDDKDKTAFCTPFGKYRFTRLPFGLMNAPATFQCMTLEVLEGQEDHSSAYIDDVLICSKTWEEHLCHIRLVLESLRANGLTTKPSKCVWAANKVEYLAL